MGGTDALRMWDAKKVSATEASERVASEKLISFVEQW